MNAQTGEMVDHINGYTLDNRRANLRIATPQQSGQIREYAARNGYGGGGGVSRRGVGQPGQAVRLRADDAGCVGGAAQRDHRAAHVAAVPQHRAVAALQGRAAQQAEQQGAVREPAGDRRPDGVHKGDVKRDVRRVLSVPAADVDGAGQADAGAERAVQRDAALRYAAGEEGAPVSVSRS